MMGPLITRPNSFWISRGLTILLVPSGRSVATLEVKAQASNRVLRLNSYNEPWIALPPDLIE